MQDWHYKNYEEFIFYFCSLIRIILTYIVELKTPKKLQTLLINVLIIFAILQCAKKIVTNNLEKLFFCDFPSNCYSAILPYTIHSKWKFLKKCHLEKHPKASNIFKKNSLGQSQAFRSEEKINVKFEYLHKQFIKLFYLFLANNAIYERDLT